VKALLLAVLASSVLAAAARAADPIEGKWIGTAGFPTDRVEVGFEFKPNEKGELKAYLYEPVVNFYGLELPGVVKRDGDTYTHADYVTTLTLKDGALEGTFLPLHAPISLKRTETLPSEKPIPAFPAGPGPRWTTKLGAPIWAPAAVRDGVAYVGTGGGLFHAIRVSDGAFLWTFTAGRPIHGEALVNGEHVIFPCDNGRLYALDRKAGKEVWRYDLGDAAADRVLPHQVIDHSGDFDFDVHAPRPVLADGVIYVGSGDGGFHAVDAAKGTRIWRFDAKGKVRGDAALGAERVYFGGWDGVLHALERKTGKEVWKKETRAEISDAPLLVAGRLVIGNRGGGFYALEPATGNVVWKMLFWGSSVESTAVPGEGSLFYVGSSDMRRVSLLDAKDGRVVWRTDVYGWAWPRPLVTPSAVYMSAIGMDPYQMRHAGSVSALDPKTGAIRWRWPSPSCGHALLTGFAAAPAIEGKTLVVGGLDGTLYGFPAE
jgi:outer membrane protein assembly factor BamB